MPQASKEVADNWTGDDGDALQTLHKNFIEVRGFIWPRQKEYDANEKEYWAIRYLIEEWDYMYIDDESEFPYMDTQFPAAEPGNNEDNSSAQPVTKD